MNPADSGKGTAVDVDAIISGLGELLISRNIEKIVAAFREALKPVLEHMAKVDSLTENAKDVYGTLKPVLERMEKVEDVVIRMEKEVADFKLSIMKEVLMLRDQLRMLNESLISLEERFTSLLERREDKIEEGRKVAGKEWVEEDKEVKVQERSTEIREQTNVSASVEEAIVKRSEEVTREEEPVFPSTKDVEKMKEIARLEARRAKLKGEISSLQMLIDMGLGGVEEKDALNAKLREMKEIEEKISSLREER